ncbi:N-acetylglucosamine-6-phosphate deacetylase [Thalassobius sp. Cn5-15]|uniref:N-acetylglucosamine-6-phosphate deacetylase n=1 Tax=Thalassobius sp. Cn5-15 TaxID=2917763 RepID=UPI001EF1C42F|nr:N-acetylglucosamine-6-phosphate deacetylase [Thalassobius sp. Cn5-15]MCG7493089.1 N-acetylglucosamine-6-phosphate deacetylase [Thalassobius sp. Cn5-15]
MTVVTYYGGRIFDGTRLHEASALRLRDGVVEAFGSEAALRAEGGVDQGTWAYLDGAILSPGFVDLQLNGGDGVMLNDAPSASVLARMVAAHRRLGATHILPTLITAAPARTTAAINAVKEALAAGQTGILGLHLEGPHLSVPRKGAHDAALIRPMTDADLAELIAAARDLPALMVTVAPENVCPDQVAALAEAGVVVALGHTDAPYEQCCDYFAAGARCATHLFNAMSQLGSRAPGLVGAALDTEHVHVGIIADGVHVHPTSLRLAWRLKGAGKLVLVSDAMAPAGTDMAAFALDGRQILREAGRLTRADGTLAGADLDLLRAVEVMHHQVGVTLAAALAAATSVPADLIGATGAGRLQVGQRAEVIRITPDLRAVTVLATV